MKQTSSISKEKEIEIDLRYLQASRYPLMRRVDQQFRVEDQWRNYERDISSLTITTKNALASMEDQQRRIVEMQQCLRVSSEFSLSSPDSISKINSNGSYSPTKVYNDAQPHPDRDEVSPSLIEFDHGSESLQLSAIRNSLDNDCFVEKQQDIYPIASALSGDKISRITKGILIKSGKPNAPKNLTVTNIQNTSFCIEWEVEDNSSDIFDYEIQYDFSMSDLEHHVVQRCSRWCLKKPIPDGRFIVQWLNENTEYRAVSLRCRNSFGWSDFSDSIRCISTSNISNDCCHRRSKFLYRIRCLKRSIQRLEDKRAGIPARQATLTKDMLRIQRRMLELSAETERAASLNEGVMISSVLHGSRQTFIKADLLSKIQEEYVTCQRAIAKLRLDNINLESISSKLSHDIANEITALNERKAALLVFDHQYSVVSTLQQVVSKQPMEVMLYHFTLWRSRTYGRLETKKIISSLVIYFRRRIYNVVWHRLRAQISNRKALSTTNSTSNLEPFGIGEKLLDDARICIEDTMGEVLHLGRHLFDNRTHNQDDHDMVLPYKKQWLLENEEDNASLTKGDIYFKAGYYQSSLRCFELVASKIPYSSTYNKMSAADAFSFYAAVHSRVGHAYAMLGLWDYAIVSFNRQLSLAKENNLEHPRLNALMCLGRCYFEKYDFKYSCSLFQEVLDTALSKENTSREGLVYTWLEKCYQGMNKPLDAKIFADKIFSMRDKRKEKVEAALLQMDTMKQRLIQISAKQCRVVVVELASVYLVLLRRQRAMKEEMLCESLKTFSASIEQINRLKILESQIITEIDEASTMKKNSMVSYLIHGTPQEMTTMVHSRQLQERLQIVKEKLDGIFDQNNRTRLQINNINDDISEIDAKIRIECGPLMQRILEKRRYRCIALNSLNTVFDDINGTSQKGFKFLALSEGKECYLSAIQNGKLEFVFTGSENDHHREEKFGHTGTITSLYLYGTRVYTGGMDSFVISWDACNMNIIFVGKGHEAAVTSIYANSMNLVTGSADTTIIQWNACDGSMIRRIYGHTQGVHCVQCSSIPNSFFGMVSSSFDTIFCWKTDRLSMWYCHNRLQLSNGKVTVLQHGELEVIVGDSLGYISVWQIETEKVIRSIKVHDSPITSLQVDATKAVCGGLDTMVKIVDIIRGEVLQTLRGHSEPVLVIAFDSTSIISVSSDGELRVWEWNHDTNKIKIQCKSDIVEEETERHFEKMVWYNT